MSYQPRSELRPRGRKPLIVVVVLLVAAAVVAGVLWFRRWSAPPPAPAPVSAPAPASAEADAGPPSTGDVAQSRSILETLSADPLLRRALTEGDVGRRWAIVTDNLAEGVSPRQQLGFLAPTRPFTVAARPGQVQVIAPESYRRYDGFADAVAAVDAQAVARTYRDLRSSVEAVYRALGYPQASLDRVTARALRRIAAAPVRDGEVAVEGRGPYTFAEASLEDLPQVEKHLLRMGPRNTRLLQAKARELLQALGFAQAGGGTPR